MKKLSSRAMAVMGASVFAVALTVGGTGSAGAAPTSGPIETMQDFKGGWLTSLTGFQDGDPISWQHRMIVRKVKGSAGVAWEQWRDCADYADKCNAGKATGDGWTAPSRVLLVLDPKGVVHGVGATGTIMLTPDGDGLSAVMMSSGQRASVTTTPTPTTSGPPPIAPRGSSNTRTTPVFGPLYNTQYAASSPSTFMCPSSVFGN
jgi:hypothetical protein